MRRVCVLAALALLAPACGASVLETDPALPPASGAERPPKPPVADTPPVPAAVEREAVHAAGALSRRCRAGEERSLGDRKRAFVAYAVADSVAYARPGGRVIRSFGLVNQNGYATLFGVLGAVLDGRCEPAWYHVQLPVRPNGTTGYVRADLVKLEIVRERIRVDLSERRLELLRDGKRVMRLNIAVGSDQTPTPTGRYYVNQRFRVTDADGPLGPAALGISGFSPVLVHWEQGGPIAIHGTNRPLSIGRPASYGCLRVDNGALLELFDQVPAGTPVVIRQ